MASSDEFIPSEDELRSVLAAALTTEIAYASKELGVAEDYSAHTFAQGSETTWLESEHSTWLVRAIFRTAHAPGRVLVQLQARLSTQHPSGYCGFVLKGAYNLGSPASTFATRSKTSEYNTAGFRVWA